MPHVHSFIKLSRCSREVWTLLVSRTLQVEAAAQEVDRGSQDHTVIKRQGQDGSRPPGIPAGAHFLTRQVYLVAAQQAPPRC